MTGRPAVQRSSHQSALCFKMHTCINATLYITGYINKIIILDLRKSQRSLNNPLIITHSFDLLQYLPIFNNSAFVHRM